MVLIIFRTRTSAYAFSGNLKKRSIPHTLISTPKQYGRSCSLSVQLAVEEYEKCKAMLESTSGDITAVRKI